LPLAVSPLLRMCLRFAMLALQALSSEALSTQAKLTSALRLRLSSLTARIATDRKVRSPAQHRAKGVGVAESLAELISNLKLLMRL